MEAATRQQFLLSAPSRRKAAAIIAAVAVLGCGSVIAQARLQARREKRSALQLKAVALQNGEKPGAAEKGKKAKGKGGVQAVNALARILLAQTGRPGTRVFFTLAAMAVLRTALSNRLARVQGWLFRATFLKNVPLFVQLISENVLLCLAQSFISATTKNLRGHLTLLWRKILTDRVHADYFQNMAYYKMAHVDRRINNAEQRIASDIPRFCSELSSLTVDCIESLTDAVFYMHRLCSYTGAKYAVSILAYVMGVGTVTGSLSPNFGKLVGQEQQLEGDYRSLHSRLRTHSESVAFYGGQTREASIIRDGFQSVFRHHSKVLHTQWWFGMIQDFLLKYCGATFAVVLIIGPFFGGALRPDDSTMGRAKMLSNMRYHTSVIIALFAAVGTLAGSSRRVFRISGYADRIRELMQVAKELREAGSAELEASSSSFVEADSIGFENVKVVTPNGAVLVEDLTLKVEPGSNLLITGPNGSGKSSLFRVLGGLWPMVEGRILKPGGGRSNASGLSRDTFYVPQRPYTSVGTLRDQLVYPLERSEEQIPLDEQRMRELLAMVDLGHLLDRYGPEEEVNWGEELSLGEQQRLGMVRLFYHHPMFAILDECTSAVTTDMEERFCQKVREMGTTCITISHRPALVAFHDIVLALDGEGGWTVHNKVGGSIFRTSSSGHLSVARGSPKIEPMSRSKSTEHLQKAPSRPGDSFRLGATALPPPKPTSGGERKSGATVVQQAFKGAAAAADEEDEEVDYHGELLARAPAYEPFGIAPVVPYLRPEAHGLGRRLKTLFKILIPRWRDQQGMRIVALAGLVIARTALSDRIANLNGTSVKNVLQQDKRAFVRLIGISVLQSLASAIVAPSLKYLTDSLALGWRRRLTEHLSKFYFRHMAFYKATHLVEGMTDADQRITRDVDKLCQDLAGLVTSMVKPVVDIAWFTWRMKKLTGRRGVVLLYAYMLLGFGFLRAVTPNMGFLTSKEQQLEGAFRFLHSRLRTHAESIAFFGGGSRELTMVAGRFAALLAHGRLLLRKRWQFGVVDEFVTKQLPHNVTWGLSMLYALDHNGDRSKTDVQGNLAHDLRFLASVVSHSFVAFGDLLELYRRFLELSGGVMRVSELLELLKEAQRDDVSPAGTPQANPLQMIERSRGTHMDLIIHNRGSPKDEIAFQEVDIVTPSRKMLARKLTVTITPGCSMLVVGPNGSGKSSIFRVLGGLWPLVSGRLTKPGMGKPLSNALSRNIFYVPQRPYTALGTLRDQLIYPLTAEEAVQDMRTELEESDPMESRPLRRLHHTLSEEDMGNSLSQRPRRCRSLIRVCVLTGIGMAGAASSGGQRGEVGLGSLDGRLRSVLRDVRLEYLLEREGGWGAVANWEDMLSLGEQQRLGMARLFFHQPKYGILDECTNATSVDVEEHLYQRAQALGITVITISQRPGLIPYHNMELRLIDGEGDWELRRINKDPV